MKKDVKTALKSYNVKQLEEKLIDLQKEKQKLERDMFRKNGSSMLIRNYPGEPQEGKYGNLKRIKKDIARVKTFLNMKLMKDGKV